MPLPRSTARLRTLTRPASFDCAQAYARLDTVYLDRRRGLQDLGASTLMPSKIAQLDLTPITTIRPDIQAGSDLRFAGTAHGDHPYAIFADHSLLVWSTRNACGDESLTAQEEDAPEQFCLAHLPPSERQP